MRSRRKLARRLGNKALVDICIIGHPVLGTRDEYGYKKATFDDDEPCPCLLQMRGSDEAAEQGNAEGVVYLRREQTVAGSDRILLTHRDGEPLDEPVAFLVQGPPLVQPSVLVVSIVTVREKPA